MRGYFGRKTAIAAALLASTGIAQAEDVEVLHWWTSGGEASALNVLKEDLVTKEIGWIDMPVAGGGGEAAMTTLRARSLPTLTPLQPKKAGTRSFLWRFRPFPNTTAIGLRPR